MIQFNYMQCKQIAELHQQQQQSNAPRWKKKATKKWNSKKEKKPYVKEPQTCLDIKRQTKPKFVMMWWVMCANHRLFVCVCVFVCNRKCTIHIYTCLRFVFPAIRCIEWRCVLQNVHTHTLITCAQRDARVHLVYERFKNSEPNCVIGLNTAIMMMNHFFASFPIASFSNKWCFVILPGFYFFLFYYYYLFIFYCCLLWVSTFFFAINHLFSYFAATSYDRKKIQKC